jgi:acyl-CoA synthetase (AMP-forming)/AMP-acid ligase II
VNTTEFLAIAGAICPERASIVFEGKRLSFAELADRVDRLASALIRAGLRHGDRVAVLQVNCPEYTEAYFAVAKAGGIFVPLNFRAKQDELAYMLNNSEAKIIFLGGRYADLIAAMKNSLTSAPQFICFDGGRDGMTSFESMLAQPASELPAEIDDEDTTILMYTAGTTGRPKGVPLKHSAFSTYILDNVTPADPDSGETNILSVPLYHVAGIQAMLAAVYGGRTVALMQQFEAAEWMATVESERANRAMLVPTMLKRIIEHPDFGARDLSSLKVITYGAASMPFAVIQKAIEMFPGVMFINAFGQTETASTIAVLGPEDHRFTGNESEQEKAKKLNRLASSIGRPLPDIEIRIADPQGNAVPPGEIGEIMARGGRIMGGYWKDAEKSAKALSPDGWLHTGDMGYMDEDGYIFLAGRGDDMIIRGGENISPEEVENVLYAHPKVADASVIGVPDPEWGQNPRAVIVLKAGEIATENEIIEYCKGKMSGFKRPRSVIFVDELPRTATGKVQRKILREKYGKPISLAAHG